MQMFQVREKEQHFGNASTTYHRTLEEAKERISKSTMSTREREDIPGEEWLEIVVVERAEQPCSTCGGEAECSPESYVRYPYCRTCHYTGRAAEHVRSDQLDYFRKMLPEAKIHFEHTGGGCMCLGIYFEGRREYLTATDGDASLPAVFDEETQEWTPIRGGWGYLGIEYDCLEEGDYKDCPCSQPDGPPCCGGGEGPVFFYTHGTAEEGGEEGGEPTYSDEALVLLVRGWLNGTVTPAPLGVA